MKKLVVMKFKLLFFFFFYFQYVIFFLFNIFCFFFVNQINNREDSIAMKLSQITEEDRREELTNEIVEISGGLLFF
jgi:hypothetical protein